MHVFRTKPLAEALSKGPLPRQEFRKYAIAWIVLTGLILIGVSLESDHHLPLSISDAIAGIILGMTLATCYIATGVAEFKTFFQVTIALGWTEAAKALLAGGLILALIGVATPLASGKHMVAVADIIGWGVFLAACARLVYYTRYVLCRRIRVPP